jgi:hypothetical protein
MFSAAASLWHSAESASRPPAALPARGNACKCCGGGKPCCLQLPPSGALLFPGCWVPDPSARALLTTAGLGIQPKPCGLLLLLQPLVYYKKPFEFLNLGILAYLGNGKALSQVSAEPGL